MIGNDDGLTKEQKYNQDLFDLAWVRAQKQAIELQTITGLLPDQVADLYLGIGISVALAARSPHALARILRLQADELEREPDQKLQ